MSDDGPQWFSGDETFWAIPKGTVYFEPSIPVSLKPTEYEQRVKAEQQIQIDAQLAPKPLAPATLAEMIQRKG